MDYENEFVRNFNIKTKKVIILIKNLTKESDIKKNKSRIKN